MIALLSLRLQLWAHIMAVNEKNTSEYTYIHTYIRLLTTSPKGLFSANYKEKDKNKNIYKLFKVTILQIIRISFLPLKFV